MCVCVCACARVRAHACVSVCVGSGEGGCMESRVFLHKELFFLLEILSQVKYSLKIIALICVFVSAEGR